MPLELVLIRHGESEGNAAKRRAEAGDETVISPEFLERHTSSFRLTDKGREQALNAGRVVRELFLENGTGFDRYVVSEYIRAMETAALLDLPNASWFTQPYLTERDWGELDRYSPEERNMRFAENLRQRHPEPFFWKPPNGESFSDLCLRVDRFLGTLHRECSDKRVVVVCHGEVMWAFRVLIERMTQQSFKELHLSKDPAHRIFNCQIVHYTRRNPHTGKLAPYANWVRMIRPTKESCEIFDWRDIVRPRHSNEELLEIVSKSKAMLS